MTERRNHILVVEDDPDIASTLLRGLSREGYTAHVTDRCEEAFRLMSSDEMDAAIIDVMIGEEDGLALVRRLRAAGITRPLIVLSALDGVQNRIDGLKAGADEYIAKPFSLGELTARLRVQEGLAQGRPPALALDPAALTVTSRDGPVRLTEREYQLLEFLAKDPGKPISRGEIFDALWAGAGSSSENVVDVYVGYLRQKLRPPEAFSFEIKTVRNVGFKLQARDGPLSK